MALKLSRRQYAEMFGPTVGDRVRLADTDLFVQVERDLVAEGGGYGNQIKFGGGKVIRDGMGQSPTALDKDCLDLVITNALILDPILGVIKADIGIKHGLIVGIGHAGNPGIQSGIGSIFTDPRTKKKNPMIVGAATEVIAGEGSIVTAGGIDTHIHFICPQQIDEAISAGITTMLGGGTGPAHGTFATTCTPGAWNLHRMFEAAEAYPMNLGFLGKGNCGTAAPLREQIQAGAIGLKLHEDLGTTPAAIDTCLGVADELDVQVAIHTDTLNESGFVEESIRAFKGRTIHTFHSEGAGGGHAPDIIRVCGEPNVLPSSTNPTRPYTVNTLDEHLDMLMVCHHLDKNLPEDVAFAESRIRGETIAAEDILHDLGAISIISSDSQAMGRIGEVITRTWQTAHVNKLRRGFLPGDNGSDNLRARRYVAKYTICPAIAHGLDAEIGSVEIGKLADLVLWQPAFFGIRPAVVVKGGVIGWAAMGDANASIPTPQPMLPRPMFGAYGVTPATTSVHFVAQAAIDDGIADRLAVRRRLAPVRNTRSLGKADLPGNDALPRIEVDPDTFAVHVDGELIEPAPVAELPLAQRYSLF